MNNDVTLEQAVLTLMITHTRCAEEVELLDESDFTLTDHKKMFRAIKELVKSGTKFDEMIFIRYINKNISRTALDFFPQCQPFSANWKEYIKQIKDLSVKRKLNLLAEAIMKSNESGETLSEQVEKEIFHIRENVQTEDFTEIKDMMQDSMNAIEQQQSSKGYSGVETGFRQLDRLTDGLQKKDYILIGARPSMGKTALATNITMNVAKMNKTVALFSLEMSKEQLVKRMILSESLVDDGKVKAKKLDDGDYAKMAMTLSKMYNSNISINDTPSLTIPQMKSMCRKLKRKRGLDLVVIDYLQLIRNKGGNNRREQVEAVSRDIKGMAKELNVPVIVISSLSRASETRQDKRPILSDLRETGQIEFDADLIMFLHRENYYNHEANETQAELIVAKQRNGGLGIIPLAWMGGCTKFLNLDQTNLDDMEQIEL